MKILKVFSKKNRKIEKSFERKRIPFNSLKEQNYFEQIKSLTKTQKMGMNTTEALLWAEHFTLFAHLSFTINPWGTILITQMRNSFRR